MGDETPFPSAVEASSRIRQDTRLSLAVGDLLARRDAIDAVLKPLLDEHREACERIAIVEEDHKRAEATAYLHATGPVESCKRQAILDPAVREAAEDLAMARMSRRITEKALRVREKDLDCLTALAHAHNRELKVLEG